MKQGLILVVVAASVAACSAPESEISAATTSPADGATVECVSLDDAGTCPDAVASASRSRHAATRRPTLGESMARSFIFWF